MGLIEEVVFEKGDEPAALVKRSGSGVGGGAGEFSGSSSSPELSFEPADEPHGLVPIHEDKDGEKN